MNTHDYLEAIKARYDVTSDYAVAKLLRVTPQKMSDWTSGRRLPGALNCFKIAGLLELEPAEVIAAIELERAKRASNDSDADEWRDWLKKVGGVAAGVAMCFVSSAMVSPAEAHQLVARLASDASYWPALCIMFIKRRVKKALQKLLSLPAQPGLQLAL